MTPTSPQNPDYFQHNEAELTAAMECEAKSGWWTRSMQTHDKRMTWWREVRFGCFVHWGVYSLLGNEWKGKKGGGYGEHIQRVLKINQADYTRDAAALFNPIHFDADAWIRLVKQAGMRYFVITAKHHDGFAMYDSDVSDYNIVKATAFGRDPMRELKDACDRHDIRFGFYYSHAFDWGEEFGPGNDWEYKNPGGDLQLKGGHDWWDVSPELRRPIVENYVDAKSIPQITELIHKYDPDILWFDTEHKLPRHENIRILRAIREASNTVVVSGRLATGPTIGQMGDYTTTADDATHFHCTSGDWESIPTTNRSYGYSKTDKSHRPTSHFVGLLSKAVARNGNVLLNVGPRGDGIIDVPDAAILEGIGAWMDRNEEAIRGNGNLRLPYQPWGVISGRDRTIYCHVYNRPADNLIVLGGVNADVVRAWLPTAPEVDLPVSKTEQGAPTVQLPDSELTPPCSVIALECSVAPVASGMRRLAPSMLANQLAAFEAELCSTAGTTIDSIERDDIEVDGELVNRVVQAESTHDGSVSDGVARGAASGLGYGSGKENDATICNWNSTDQWLEWPLALDIPTRFMVEFDYVGGKPHGGGTIKIEVGPDTFHHTIAPHVDEVPYHTERLGTTQLAAGDHIVKLRAVSVGPGEVCRPLAIRLIPPAD